MKKLIYLWIIIGFFSSCGQQESAESIEEPNIDEVTVEKVKDQLMEEYGREHEFRIERGVEKAALLWRESDGTTEDFSDFCMENFIADQSELDQVFDRLANNFEYLYGYMGRIGVELNRQIHEDRGPILPIDQQFGAYNASAHIQNDFFENKIAFMIVLNFPQYTLEEKNEMGKNWSDRQWGYARLGEYYQARIPPAIIQENSRIYSEGRLYISEYNIYAGKLLSSDMETPFPENMRLLAHWNIRDEIKSNYDQSDGLEKQQMLYNVMLRIINQDIPMEVINSDQYEWDPINNQVYQDGETINFQPEDTRRYQYLLDNFNAMKSVDPYYSQLDTYIKRRFDSSMEIPMEEVENLFTQYASSPLLKDVAMLIKERLGRDLQPFDLWYNGFVGRGGLPESELDKITKQRYPNATAMDQDLPRMLIDLGFSTEKANFIGEKVDVDAARGSGHAMRASMREKPSHLRTRIDADGMNYKGYNIAIHEFGHNVEQTISVHEVDNYFINGIPNTGFTEAIAFMFQKRDLELLGIDQPDPMMQYMEVLDIFWDNYEMMGVSLVDMRVWEWMYENPDASALQLKEAVVEIAKEVWNEYYADVFGVSDIPLLAIYSHMIQSPLYLMNYPYGRLIMFQLEDYIEGRDFAEEIFRIYSIGRLTPQRWMDEAVGNQISNEPIFDAVKEALDAIGS
ncbi:MAG: hypothetical protein ACOC2E_00460 [Bacteroidota bacterium]